METRPPLSGQSSQSETESDRLDTWKLIGAYVHRDIRTAQRWERTEQLPVHRPANAKRGSVYAYKSEIDIWWRARDPLFRLRERETLATTQVLATPLRSSKCCRWLLRGGLALLVVLVLAAAKLIILPLLAPANSRIAREVTVAMLPFQTLPHDQDDRALAAGIMQEVTNVLAKSAEVHVIPIAGPGEAQADPLSLDQVIQKYHPEVLVEGSIARSGDKVQVAVQVIDVSTGRKLSADQFERTSQSNRALGGEIGRLISESVRSSLLPSNSAP